jgi:hypothetical protein
MDHTLFNETLKAVRMSAFGEIKKPRRKQLRSISM